MPDTIDRDHQALRDRRAANARARYHQLKADAGSPTNRAWIPAGPTTLITRPLPRPAAGPYCTRCGGHDSHWTGCDRPGLNENPKPPTPEPR